MEGHMANETYFGQVKTTYDCIIVFEACRLGLLPRVQRRLSEKERCAIRHGSVFVWDEREAGMRRWTDGKSWSASRVSGSFLQYREMEGKRGANTGNGSRRTTRADRPGRSPGSPFSVSVDDNDHNNGNDDNDNDSYRYKKNGLTKQSFSMQGPTGQLHLIAYSSRHCEDQHPLPQPSTDPMLRHIKPPSNLYPESSLHESHCAPVSMRVGIPRTLFGRSTELQPWGPEEQHQRPPISHPHPTYLEHHSASYYQPHHHDNHRLHQHQNTHPLQQQQQQQQHQQHQHHQHHQHHPHHPPHPPHPPHQHYQHAPHHQHLAHPSGQILQHFNRPSSPNGTPNSATDNRVRGSEEAFPWPGPYQQESDLASSRAKERNSTPLPENHSIYPPPSHSSHSLPHHPHQGYMKYTHPDEDGGLPPNDTWPEHNRSRRALAPHSPPNRRSYTPLPPPSRHQVAAPRTNGIPLHYSDEESGGSVANGFPPCPVRPVRPVFPAAPTTACSYPNILSEKAEDDNVYGSAALPTTISNSSPHPTTLTNGSKSNTTSTSATTTLTSYNTCSGRDRRTPAGPSQPGTPQSLLPLPTPVTHSPHCTSHPRPGNLPRLHISTVLPPLPPLSDLTGSPLPAEESSHGTRVSGVGGAGANTAVKTTSSSADDGHRITLPSVRAPHHVLGELALDSYEAWREGLELYGRQRHVSCPGRPGTTPFGLRTSHSSLARGDDHDAVARLDRVAFRWDLCSTPISTSSVVPSKRSWPVSPLLPHATATSDASGPVQHRKRRLNSGDSPEPENSDQSRGGFVDCSSTGDRTDKAWISRKRSKLQLETEGLENKID